MKKIASTIVGTVLSFSVLLCQQKKVDSLRQLLPRTNGEEKIKVLQALVLNHWLNYPDSAKLYARAAIRYSNEVNDVGLKSTSNRLMGGAFIYLSEYDSAKFYTEKAVQFANDSKDSTLISVAANNLGVIYYYKGSYPEAYEYLLKSYTIRLKKNQEFALGATLNNFGLIFMKVGDYKSARRYFNEAFKKENKNSKLEALDNIGAVCLLEENYIGAQQFYSEAIHLTQSINNHLFEARALDGLGQVHHGMHLNAEARSYFAKALILRKKIKDRKGESETYYHLSKMFTPANTDSAFYFLRKSQLLAFRLKATDRLLENYMHFKILFQQNNHLDSALFYQTKYDEVKEKQFNENARRSIEGIKLKIQEEESQRQLVLKDVQLAQKNYQIILFLIVGALLVMGVGVIIWFYGGQRKLGRHLAITNQKISRQRDEIERKTVELEKQLDELKRAEVQLVQSEKMASLGVLTAGIAHEINNPINFISVGIEALSKKQKQLNTYFTQLINRESISRERILETQENIIQLVKDIKIGTARTEEIIASLRTFSHVNEAELKLADINNGIESTLVLLNSRLKNRIDVIRKLDKDLPPILCYPGQLNQVFMNMLSNAAEAIIAKGTITVTTSKVNDQIQITIADTGSGIPIKIQKKIFEPFFTTKDVGAGTGLGLSISYGIIKHHKGNITVNSELGKGTEFIILIPINLQDTNDNRSESTIESKFTLHD